MAHSHAANDQTVTNDDSRTFSGIHPQRSVKKPAVARLRLDENTSSYLKSVSSA